MGEVVQEISAKCRRRLLVDGDLSAPRENRTKLATTKASLLRWPDRHGQAANIEAILARERTDVDTSTVLKPMRTRFQHYGKYPAASEALGENHAPCVL